MTKEEIKAQAEKLAEAFGYNINSDHIDVINVKDAYCIGFTNGEKEKQLYAKATSIAFSEWVAKLYYKIEKDDEGNEWQEKLLGRYYTTEQLFTLFIKEQK